MTSLASGSPRTWSSGPEGGTSALPRSALRSGDCALFERVEDQVRARDLERRWRAVRPLHDAVRADHHERSCGHAALLVVDAELAGHLALRVEVREQRDRHAELLLEGIVRIRGVYRHAVQIDAARLQLAEHLLVDVQLVGADRAEVERIEGEDHRPPPKRLEGDLLPVLVTQAEVRRLRACLDHGLAPESE